MQDARDGRIDLDLGATINAALPFVGSVTIAGIFASIAIGIGFALIIMPGLILLTFLSLIVPEIVVGGATAYESFGRSWRTVRGYAWHVFGTYVLVFVIMIVGRVRGRADPAWRCRTRPGTSSPTSWWAPWSRRSSPRW